MAVVQNVSVSHNRNKLEMGDRKIAGKIPECFSVYF